MGHKSEGEVANGIYHQTCGLTSKAHGIPLALLAPVGLHWSCPMALCCAHPCAPWQRDGEQLSDAVPRLQGSGADGGSSIPTLSPEIHARQLRLCCSLYGCYKIRVGPGTPLPWEQTWV